jgi:hypothetical protein
MSELTSGLAIHSREPIHVTALQKLATSHSMRIEDDENLCIEVLARHLIQRTVTGLP